MKWKCVSKKEILILQIDSIKKSPLQKVQLLEINICPIHLKHTNHTNQCHYWPSLKRVISSSSISISSKYNFGKCVSGI